MKQCTSITDLWTGFSQTTIVFTSIPSGYNPICYGKSWKTKHHPKTALELCGGVNLGTLSPDGYDFVTTMIYEDGDTIISTGQVRRDGPNTDTYTLDLQGTYTGPSDCVDIRRSATFLYPVHPGVIRIEGLEGVVLSDDSRIYFVERGTFTLLNADAELQYVKVVVVDVDSVSWDPVTSTLQLNTTATIERLCCMPTITHWGLILLILAMAGFSVYMIMRRRKVGTV